MTKRLYWHPTFKEWQMTQDPFGNLQEWGRVLEDLNKAFQNGRGEDCQRGLIRILRYRGNWRLREETLQHIEDLQNPKEELINEVLKIVDDENIYYEARIIALHALMKILEKKINCPEQLTKEVKKVIYRINSTPQPPFFQEVIDNCIQKSKIN
jgi:hypothetical protein